MRNFQKFARFKIKDFSRIFKCFQAPYLFSSTFKGLEVFLPNSSIFKDFSSTLWTLPLQPPARCCPRWVSLYSTENSGDPASRRDISGLLAFSVAATTLRILTAGKSGHAKVWCLEQGADLHMAQLMPLLLTVSCSSKIQIGFTFLVPAHLGSTGQRAVKRVCVCFFLLFVYCYLSLSLTTGDAWN